MKCANYLFVLFMFVFSLLKGQDYLPTLEVGKEYKIFHEKGMSDGSFYYPVITCDTIIRNGFVYNFVDCDKGNCRKVYIREDVQNERLYYVEPEIGNNEILFLDYKLEKGDSLQYYEDRKLIVDTVYMDFIYGADRKIIEFAQFATLIEGIGNCMEGPYPFKVQDEYKTIWETLNLNCDSIVLSTESTILNSEEGIVITPNPFSSKVIFEFTDYESQYSKKEITIYNSEGRLKKRIEKYGNIFEVDMDEFKKGFYYIEIVNVNQRIIKKLLKI